MAVVIKKMNIPESCYSCDIRMNCDACEGHEMYCPFVGHIGYDPESIGVLVKGAPICPTDHRAEGCPLEDLEEITMKHYKQGREDEKAIEAGEMISAFNPD